MLIDVEIESKKLVKYGRIGEHPMQSIYTGYYFIL